MMAESNEIPPSRHEPLPAWARSILSSVRLPAQTLAPTVSVLPNGVHLIVQPETSSASVTVSGRIRNDPQVQEPAGQEGVNDVTEALMPFGTATYGRVGYQAALDAIAASVTTGASFSLQVLAPDFDRGMQLLADDELHPAFDARDFAIVKAQEQQALVGEVRSPDRLTEAALAKALYPAGDPAQRFATPESAAALTLDDVRDWYAAAYRPDLTTIVVVGDVTPALARSVVERYFGAWAARGPRPQTQPPAVPENAAASVVVPATGRVQSSVTLAETIGVKRTSSDWAALQVANAALTGGFYSSLLYHDVREVHGYAYSIGSDFSVEPTRGTFSIEYGCDAKNIVPAQELIVNDLLRLQRAPLSANRLTSAKALLMGSVPIREASYDGLADGLLGESVEGLPWNQERIDARHELAVTSSDVQQALRAWVRPNDFIRIVEGPGPP